MRLLHTFFVIHLLYLLKYVKALPKRDKLPADSAPGFPGPLIPIDSNDKSCVNLRFNCGDGTCILTSQKCDGNRDCPNGNDENFCGATWQWLCAFNKCMANQCIPSEWKCDGSRQCNDGLDEKDCFPPCQDDVLFTCGNGNCVLKTLACDGRDDCGNGADESLPNCVPADCPDDSFSCSDGGCIPYSDRCDGRSHCRDGSDENGDLCRTDCPTKFFTCHNGQCIPLDGLCNGRADCRDGSDEDDTTCCKGNRGVRDCLSISGNGGEHEETSEFLEAAEKGEKAIETRKLEDIGFFRDGIVPAVNSATSIHQSLLNPSSEIDTFLNGLAVETATEDFLKSQGISPGNKKKRQLRPFSDRFPIFLMNFFNTIFGTNVCFNPIYCPFNAPYRTFDGSCNNQFIPLLGKATTPFARLLDPEYQDPFKLWKPRSKANDGSDLPCARKVSQVLSSCTLSKNTANTMMVMQWGQFIDHDLTLSPTTKLTYLGASIKCCNTQKVHPECFPICIPQDDPHFGCFGKTCMNFVRTLSAPSIWCTFGPRQQVNDLSHFLDGSMIYGSSSTTANSLRTHSGGELKSQSGILPPDTSSGPCKPSAGFCFRAGDDRVNEQPNLALTHIMWMREHNRIAAHYTGLGYNDQDAFQKARKLVIAEIQHITYNEFLPVVLGPTYMSSVDLNPRPQGQYFFGYSPIIDPRITNAFATAAFRFGHSLLSDHIEQHWSDFSIPTELEFSSLFVNQGMNHYWGNRMLFAFGLARQHPENVDRCFTTEVTERLFEQAGVSGSGLDLVALNIQRGRDHGLPPYVDYRNKFCNSPNKINSFSDMNWLSPAVMSLLTQVYASVNDIDLFVGGLLEPHQPGALVGETFQCIIGDTFFGLKRGDRYFYENHQLPAAFTLAELDAIRSQVSLARIFCDNGDSITKIQPDILLSSGTPVSCNVIDKLDLAGVFL